MKTFKLTVSSPDGNIFSGNAVNISLRGSLGDLAVMAGHIPFITAVVPCKCKIELENGEEKNAVTQGGILTVAKEGVTLLSGSFEFTD